MVFMFRVWPCVSRRVGVVLTRRRIKGPRLGHPPPVPWAYEDEIEKGPAVPGVRQTDEEERPDGRGLPALEVRGLLARGHGAQTGREARRRAALLPRLAAFRQETGRHGDGPAHVPQAHPMVLERPA